MTQLEFIFLILGISISAAMIIVIAIIYLVSASNKQKYAYQIKDASNSIRIYVIDLNNEVVHYVNRSKLYKRSTIHISEFYAKFPTGEREELVDWINALSDKEAHVPSFKEIHVISKHRRTNLFSLLQVTKIDYEKQLIYLDSNLIKANLTRKNVNSETYNFSTQESFSRTISSQTSTRGITFAFNFFDKRNKDEQIARIVYLQFVNVFNTYVSSYRPIIEYGTHHIVASDLRISSRTQLMQLITSIKNDINKYLLIDALQDRIGYSIGVCENKHFINEPEKLVNTVIELSNAAQDENESILWHEEGYKVNMTGEDTYRTEVERIIRDKKLKYSFRPIVNLDKAKILGYQSFVEPLDSFFGSIDELKAYAVRTEDDRVLFATIARTLISRFAQEKESDTHRLFFPINSYEKEYANRTLSHIQNIKTTHIVLVYKDKDVLEFNENHYDDLLTEIKTFKSKGYEIALEIMDSELTLASNVFASFDFFLIDVHANLKVGKQYSQRLLYGFRGLVEKLLKYHRPIVAIDVQSWDSIELIEKLGINLVSSDVIAPKDENVLPVPQKSIMKIKNITD